MHDRDGRKIQHVTGVRVETSNTALTQNHVFVPFGKDILGRQEQLVDRGGHPALEQHRNIGSTSPTQHRIILHVAGPDLNDVGILSDKVDPFGVQRLRHDRHPSGLPGSGQHLEPLLPQSLPGVG